MTLTSPSLKLNTVAEPSTAAIGNVSCNLVVGGKDGSVEMLDVSSGHTKWNVRSHTKNRIDSVTFDSSDKFIVCGGRDFRVVVRDSSCGEVVANLDSDGPVNQVKFSPNGERVFAAGNSGRILIWNISTSEQVGELDGHEAHIWGISVSPDGELVASAGWDGTVRLWDANSCKQVAHFGFDGSVGSHYGSVYSAQFSPDGDSFFAASQDRRVRQFDCKSLSLTREFVLDGVPNCVHLTNDGTHLVTQCDVLSIWDISTGRRLSRLSHFNGSMLAMGVGVANVSNYLAVPVGDRQLCIVSVSDGRVLRELGGVDSGAISVDRRSYGVFWTHDDSRVLLVGNSGHVFVWGAGCP